MKSIVYGVVRENARCCLPVGVISKLHYDSGSDCKFYYHSKDINVAIPLKDLDFTKSCDPNHKYATILSESELRGAVRGSSAYSNKELLYEYCGKTIIVQKIDHFEERYWSEVPGLTIKGEWLKIISKEEAYGEIKNYISVDSCSIFFTIKGAANCLQCIRQNYPEAYIVELEVENSHRLFVVVGKLVKILSEAEACKALWANNKKMCKIKHEFK